MKKRILGLALALIMIISLLPLTTFAAPPASVKVVCYQPARIDVSVYDGAAPQYITVVDNDATADTTDKKLVASSTVAADNYAKLEYKLSGGELTLEFTLKNFDATNVPADGPGAFFNFSIGGDYDIKVTLEGENKISGAYEAFGFANTGDVTFTGNGSLDINCTGQKGYEDTIYKKGSGALIFEDVSLKVTQATTGGMYNAIRNNGKIIIDGATLEVSCAAGDGLRTATARSDGLLAASPNVEVIIKNGANVNITTAYQNNYNAISCYGKVTIENSNVTLAAGHAANSRASRTVPYITGGTAKTGELGNGHKDFKSDLKAFSLTPGDAIAAGAIRYLEVKHECVAAGTDDHNCLTAELCACGKEVAPAKTAHIAGANADDCTKDTICGNPGCTQVFEAATATAHTPKADDGDCTTDILCANPGCTQVATKGAEKHKDTRTDCAVAGTCANPGCQHAFAAGQHTGGTATCKAKAKCEICSKEYGELGACKPEADDGNCTTDIKCSVCGKVTTKGETAHKYTDKADTTCNNAGCTNTRKVEGTENPKTGDNTVLVLALSLMAASAAAFVCTKKFAR